MSLFRKLIFFTMLAIIIPLLLLSIANYNKTEKTIINNTQISTNEMLKSELSNIDMYLREISAVSYSIAYSPKISEALYGIQTAEANGNTADYEQSKKQIVELMYELCNSQVYINNVYIFTKNGVFSTNATINTISAVTGSKWYNDLLAHQIGIVFLGANSINAKQGNSIISAVRPMYHSNTAAISGIIMVEMDGSAIFKKLNSMLLTENSKNYLFDSLGNQVFPFDTVHQDIISLRNQKNAITIDSTSEYSGWTLVSVIPKNDYQKDTQNLGIYNLILILICVFISAVFTILFSRYITQPIIKLSSVMKEVERGNFNQHLNLNRNDEVGKLTHSFNSMIGEINRLIKENYIEKLQKREAQLSLLQSQIKPHFIYNTLVSIKWEAEKNDDQLVSSRITSLVRLLQLSVNKGNLFISLKDEVAMLQSYLNLIEIYINGRVKVHINIDNRLENFMVIKLILQPLVENSIYHGILERDGDGNVWIDVYTDKKDVVLRVRDDGVGVPSQMVNDLLIKNADMDINKGIGLWNIKERLELYYSNKIEFNIESAVNVGFTVEIKWKDIL